MTAPERRWFAFSLRTMLVVFTLASVPIAIWAYYSHWIEERHYYLEQVTYSYGTSLNAPRPPLVLWLLGEEGIATIAPYGDAELSEVEYAEKLFPEAMVMDDRLPSWRNSPERAKLMSWIRSINEGLPTKVTP